MYNGFGVPTSQILEVLSTKLGIILLAVVYYLLELHKIRFGLVHVKREFHDKKRLLSHNRRENDMYHATKWFKYPTFEGFNSYSVNHHAEEVMLW